MHVATVHVLQCVRLAYMAAPLVFGIPYQEFTYGDATLFELINAVKEAKGGLKTRAWTTAKEFHDSTAQFVSHSALSRFDRAP